MKIELQPGDYARIKWNGNEYTKDQHYHIKEVRKKEVLVRVPGSYRKLTIRKCSIRDYEVIKDYKDKRAS